MEQGKSELGFVRNYETSEFYPSVSPKSQLFPCNWTRLIRIRISTSGNPKTYTEDLNVLSHSQYKITTINSELDGLLALLNLRLGEVHLPCGTWSQSASHKANEGIAWLPFGCSIATHKPKKDCFSPPIQVRAIRLFDCQPNSLKRIASVPLSKFGLRPWGGSRTKIFLFLKILF